jgi:hypothetical protein
VTIKESRPSFLPKPVKDFSCLHRFRIKAENLYKIGLRPLTGGEVINHMATLETGRLYSNQMIVDSQTITTCNLA